MSEYQYYEFKNVDRQLTPSEIAELRRYSTRARITPTSFINEYNWGDFKGDPDDWMEKYFDAFLYYANWGTHTLKFQLPAILLDPSIARQYCDGEEVEVRVTSNKVILSFCSSDEDQEYDSEGAEIHSMIGIRNDLARGDFRALYLGWLLRVDLDDLADNELEPPVPPGLGELSQSLENFVDFLRIDVDLITAAAVASPPLRVPVVDNQEIHTWVKQLPLEEKDEILVKLVANDDSTQTQLLMQRFMKETRPGTNSSKSAPRTVGQLRESAQLHMKERIRAHELMVAKEKAKTEREATLSRERHLNSIMGQEASLWLKVEELLNTKLGKNYDKALNILVDLRDIERRTKKGDFRGKLENLRVSHARKPAFISRLDGVGLR